MFAEQQNNPYKVYLFPTNLSEKIIWEHCFLDYQIWRKNITWFYIELPTPQRRLPHIHAEIWALLTTVHYTHTISFNFDFQFH